MCNIYGGLYNNVRKIKCGWFNWQGVWDNKDTDTDKVTQREKETVSQLGRGQTGDGRSP